MFQLIYSVVLEVNRDYGISCEGSSRSRRDDENWSGTLLAANRRLIQSRWLEHSVYAESGETLLGNGLAGTARLCCCLRLPADNRGPLKALAEAVPGK